MVQFKPNPDGSVTAIIEKDDKCHICGGDMLSCGCGWTGKKSKESKEPDPRVKAMAKAISKGDTLEDIMSKSVEEKEQIYEDLEKQYHGKIRANEDKSGFPAVIILVDGKPKYKTDCLSIESWWRKRENLKHFIIYPPDGHGYGVSTKTKEEAVKKAAEYFKVKEEEIDEAKGWRIMDLGVD